MLKLFFLITLCSAIFLWYLHEYHTLKFFEIIRSVPYSSIIMKKIHSYLTISSPVISSRTSSNKVFTVDELKEYNGEEDSKGTYLAILGEVYDVGKGQLHYGPGGPYHAFVGRDASRLFITGDFSNTNSESLDHILDLSFGELLSLKDWSKFYKKEYDYKGKLAGRYYDKKGRKTKYSLQVMEKLNEAEQNKKMKNDEKELFPPCNVEWNAEIGTKVWCSNKSGGVVRSWIGVPRKLYKVGSESYRCACVDMNEIQRNGSPQYARRGHLQQYENCDPLQHACFIKD